MSYLEKLLEGYFAGLTIGMPRDRSMLCRALTSADNPVVRGCLLGELARRLVVQAQEARHRRHEIDFEPDSAGTADELRGLERGSALPTAAVDPRYTKLPERADSMNR